MTKKIYLLGAGGHAKVILDIIQSQGVVVEELFDDNPTISSFMGIPVSQNVKSPLIVSVGNNNIRNKIVTKLANVKYETAVSTHAIVSETASIGEGSVIMQGAVVQSSTKIGKHVIINTSASVDHDCFIHDFVHIAPGSHLCGNVEVGEGTFIGAGSVIIPGIKIGKWSVVGAGSVVVKDIPDYVVAVGSPCKIIKHIDNDK